MRRHESYRGFEVWFNDFKMSLKMYWVLGIALGCAHLLLFGLVARAWLGAIDSRLLWHWAVSHVFSLWDPKSRMDFPYEGQVYRMTASQLAQYLQPYVAGFIAKLAVSFVLTGGIYLTIPFLTGWFRRHARRIAGPEHLRGARLATEGEFRRELRRLGEPLDLPLGDHRLPKSAEVKHVLILGRPGVGKTVALGAVLERLMARGDRGVLYDFKGDYTERFFRPGRDLLFNPLDTRCAGWNLFNDIGTQMDVDALAGSLIPRAYHADPYWNDAARAVFTGLLHHLYATGQRDNGSIWKAVSSDVKEIAKWLRSTPHGEAGHTFIQDAGSKQALSVHSVVMQYARPFEYLAAIDGAFSAVEWLRSGEGWIFVTSFSDIQDTLRPILSLFVDLVGRKLLAMSDDPDRRLFFFLDEFGTLQRLPTLVNLLTLSRSKGGSVWLGIQDVGQIDKIYTKDLRQAIVNACGNSVTFAVADPDTARFLSDKVGETEFLEMDQTYSMGPSDMRDGVSLAQRKKREALVLPSELMSLPDLTAYLKIGGLPLTKAQFRFRPYPARQPAFSLRPDLRLDAVAGDLASSTRDSIGDPDDAGLDLELPFEREDHLEGANEPEATPAEGIPSWIEPAWLTKTRNEEKDAVDAREDEQRKAAEELHHDGVGLDEKGREDDGSRAIEISDGLEGPFGG